MSNRDWEIVISGEVMRGYVESELARMAKEKQAQEMQKRADESRMEEMLEAFAQFESAIKADPQKLKIFKAFQEKFANDPDYTNATKKEFVDAIMMLDLE